MGRYTQIYPFPSEQQVFSLFQIPLTNLLKNKFELIWLKNVPFSEIDRLPYWEFEEYIKLFNERINEQNKQRQKEEEESRALSKSVMPQIPDISKMMSNISLPKI